MPEEVINVTYRPHQLRTVRRFLKAGGELARTRAAQMSSLSLEDVDKLIKLDPVCGAYAAGKEPPAEKPAAVRRNKPPPRGPEGAE